MDIHCFLIICASMLAVYCAMSCLTIEATNTTTDQLSLLALKAQITHDPHNFLATNWSAATSVCSWTGITCDANNRVTVLNLTSMALTGTIPPQIGNLSSLVEIRFRNNSFHGSLPVELVNLQRLELINFKENDLEGEMPPWLGSLPKLQHLYLSDNDFTGPIPPSICNISTLRTLDFMDNDLHGYIPQDIGNLVNLETFILYGNPLVSGPIPSAMFNISSLININFAMNRMSGNLPDNMCQNLPVVKYLILHHNQFVGSIPTSLWQCQELVRISLDYNRFTGTMPASIGKLKLLRELYLDNNNWEGEIPEEVGSLKALERLRIGNSRGITGYIPRSLGNCTSLWELDLGDSSLTGPIPPELADLPNLRILNLHNNSLTGPIPSAIFNISTLDSLALYMNQLSGHLPSDIGLWLPNLTSLYLWDNQLQGIIPDSISNASNLYLLSLSQNSFSGPLPNTLGNLRYLERIDVASNQLTRESFTTELSFLSPLSNCKHLTRILISDNPLNGTLPASIGNLTSVEIFKADDCQIEGSIPQEVGHLRNLTNLSLGNNKLIGSIPVTVGKMRMLQVLNLVDNGLQGPIPNEICQLRNLGEVYLSRNKLHGSIPSCISDIISLRVLHLSSNNFTSTIPSTLWSLRDVLDVRLSMNSLNGSLSMDIENLKVVTQIDISKNQLSGEIPSSIGSLQNLMKFSIAHNKIQGPIPESLGNLISLDFLDLSNNSLVGGIPKSLEKLLYLKFINVSFNSLEGEIPIGGSFANFSAKSFMGNSALCGATRLQVPPCRTSTHLGSKNRKVSSKILIYILSAIAAAILVLGLVFVLFRCRMRNAKFLDTEDGLTLATWRRISYQELGHATNGFNESNLLGTGGFGSVFKGKLPDGLDIAVKVFNLQVERALKSFDDECEVMSKIRHRNLIKIVSSCSNIDFRALVLEYMPNGSLEKWLYSHNYCLDILQRLNIMIDVASALEYLHHGSATPIVHCDIKPSNVLLDLDLVAHLSDFGIAKLSGDRDSIIQTNTLATIGYMAPEYGSEGIVSAAGDIYSFGILMMETFTRRKPTDEEFEEGRSLKCWVEEALPDSVTEIADANLLGEENFTARKDCILSTLEVAVNCSVESAERRIDIKDVLSRLKKIRTKFEKSVSTTSM